MGVAVVNIGEVFVTVAEHQVPMVASFQNIDGVGPVVRVISINGMGVLPGFVSVRVGVMARCDHDHADEGNGEGNHDRGGESVTVDGPGE